MTANFTGNGNPPVVCCVVSSSDALNYSLMIKQGVQLMYWHSISQTDVM